MSKFPYLPLCVDAYRNDTAHLTLEQHGAYLTLIMLAWRLPGCRLPDDDVKLARMLGVTAKKWASLKPAVMDFWTLADGFWSQKRLEKERDFVSRRAKTSADNGAHGGRPKSLNLQDSQNPAGSSQVTQLEPGGKAPNTLHLTQDTKDRAPIEPPALNPEGVEADKATAASRTVGQRGPYFFEAGVIRLTEADFRKWEQTFTELALASELRGLEAWASRHGKNWYLPVQSLLASKNREARQLREAGRLTAEAVAKAQIEAGQHRKKGYLLV